jgi:FtsZ-interacting cell division protein ZipA
MENQQPMGSNQKVTKKTWIILGLVVVIVLVIFGCNDDTDNKKETAKKAEVVSKPQENKKEKTEEVKQEEPAEPFDIVVTNQTIKKIDKKYRYFFDVRNKDKKDFNGEVSITLHNNEQNSALGRNTFKTTSPIEPQLGNSVYIDINTGPVSAHGEFGITKFKYEVKIDNKIVKTGEDEITNKLSL